MKNTKSFYFILPTIIFMHYFVLTKIQAFKFDGFRGIAMEIHELKSTMFPKSEITFNSLEFENGELVKKIKKVKIAGTGYVKLKLGKSYNVKTQNNWLCKISKT